MGCALLPWGCSAWRGASRLEGVPAAWMQWRLWTLLGVPPLGRIALPGGAFPLCWEWGLAGTGGAPKEGRSAGGQTQPRTDWRVRWDPATDSGPPENPATALPPLESACSAGRWVRGRPSGAATPARGTWCGRAERGLSSPHPWSSNRRYGDMRNLDRSPLDHSLPRLSRPLTPPVEAPRHTPVAPPPGPRKGTPS